MAWLPIVLAIVLPLLGVAVVWGALGQRVKGAEERLKLAEGRIDKIRDTSVTRDDLRELEGRFKDDLAAFSDQMIATLRQVLREEREG